MTHDLDIVNLRFVIGMVVAKRQALGDRFDDNVIDRGVGVAREAIRKAVIDFIRDERIPPEMGHARHD